ncbi:molybdenum cofactor biosynthesis protein MoaE [Microbacterium halophytorum]|uniref:molybdenum cofactor biosynthesis protein MoaE n=1 Tax=Microbacterium halophytorum TaxID=2067568 RepID=UPI000CFD640F|nr:molybdenum cofactor biosynthesis protein MoaE [Microbacterium halophytorum]
MSPVTIARISEEPLDVAAHLAAVEHAEAGAETSFIGRVRDHDPDASGAVDALEYTSHPDAERTLGELARRAAEEHGARVAVSHRIGRLAVGDAAVVIAVSAAHRGEAFAACRQVIEDIKRELPVWKRQLASDGSAVWKGLGG